MDTCEEVFDHTQRQAVAKRLDIHTPWARHEGETENQTYKVDV